MSRLWRKIPLTLGFIGSCLTFLSGKDSDVFQILLVVMTLDVITGVAKAIHNKRLRSYVVAGGIVKKGAIMLSIIFAYALDWLVNGRIPVFATMMVWLAIGGESLSIVENLGACGVELPAALTSRIMSISDPDSEIYSETLVRKYYDHEDELMRTEIEIDIEEEMKND